MSKKKSTKVKSVKTKSKAKTSKAKVPDVTFDKNPIVNRAEPTLKEQTLNSITSILKHRMHPRELNQAVSEIKVVLESNGIIWGS